MKSRYIIFSGFAFALLIVFIFPFNNNKSASSTLTPSPQPTSIVQRVTSTPLPTLKPITNTPAPTFTVLPTASPVPTSNLPKEPIPSEGLERHAIFHYPKIKDPTILGDKLNGESFKATAYLTLPFRKSDLQRNPTHPNQLYEVTEGWRYSADEMAIHGFEPSHSGIDFYVPYGTDVLAPVDGYAMSSYHLIPLKDKDGNRRKYKDKNVSMGLGYFVYIYAPDVQRWVELAHLSDVDGSIPFSQPELKDGIWTPPTKGIKLQEYMTRSQVVQVRKGQVIGKSGSSGLLLGDFEEYKQGSNRPIVFTRDQFESWDEPHLHFEEFWIHQERGIKGWLRDPYGIYMTSGYYPNGMNTKQMGKDPLWLLDENGMPLFVSQ